LVAEQEIQLMPYSRKLFQPLDLLAPIGICAGAFTLCLIAAITASGPGRWVSAATGAVFLLGIPAWYWIRCKATKIDFITKHNISIVLGKLNNKQGKATIEQWTEELISFWISVSLIRDDRPVVPSMAEVTKSISGLTGLFLDQERLGTLGRTVRGYSWGSMFAVGMLPNDPGYVKSIFRHEVSHHVLDKCGWPMNEAAHHVMFQKVGLGA